MIFSRKSVLDEGDLWHRAIGRTPAPLSPALACALCAIILALGVLVLPRAAFAMPAFPGLKSATQPDGTQVSYYLHGDEHFSYFTAADGSLLQQDPETGALC